MFILLINPQIWKYARYPFLGFFYFTAVATFVPVYIGMAPGIEYKKEFVIEVILNSKVLGEGLAYSLGIP